MQRMLPR